MVMAVVPWEVSRSRTAPHPIGTQTISCQNWVVPRGRYHHPHPHLPSTVSFRHCLRRVRSESGHCTLDTWCETGPPNRIRATGTSSTRKRMPRREHNERRTIALVWYCTPPGNTPSGVRMRETIGGRKPRARDTRTTKTLRPHSNHSSSQW